MDAKAKKILFSTYWKNGWIDDKLRTISKEDFEYAKSKGLMFDPFSIKHDACIKAVAKLVSEISLERVAAAFLSSLSTRRLDWRSALCSRIMAEKIPAHRYRKVVSGEFYPGRGPTFRSYTCGVCQNAGVIGSEKYIDEDLSVLNFERLKWGGVRHGDVIYLLFDLTQFAAEPTPEPTRDDTLILKNILKVIDSSPANDSAGKLAKRLADTFDSSDAERRTLIEILAAVGVLRSKEDEDADGDVGDWDFAGAWRGRDGYCRKTVRKLFGV